MNNDKPSHISPIITAAQLKIFSRACWSFLLLAFAFTPMVASRTAQGGDSSIRLEPGIPIEREIGGGERHSHTVTLTAGQFVNIRVAQHNSWVVLTLRSLEGRALTRVEHSPGLWAVTRVVHIAEETGNYALDVQPYEKEAQSGKYVINIEELRPATYRSFINARAGQTMSVHLVGVPDAVVEFYPPEAGTEPLEGADGVKDWSGKLPETGRYAIFVGHTRDGVKSAPYTLEITIR